MRGTETLEVADILFTFQVDRRSRTVRSKARGVIRIDALVEHVHTLAKEKVFAYPHLIDAREARLRITAGDVRKLVDRIETLRKIHGTARTAFVTRYPADFGMMRMYGTLSEECDPGFAVFREIGEAENWILSREMVRKGT